jgi:hypothetical protein
MVAHKKIDRALHQALKLQPTIGKSRGDSLLSIVEQLADEFGKAVLEDRQWNAYKAMRYRLYSSAHFVQPPEISAEAEASDYVIFRDGLGNRWGQKPTGPSRKRTVAIDD